MHDYHEGLEGFSPNQILHDGCAECEWRAKTRNLGISYLDQFNFVRAWERAAEYNRRGLPDVSRAERPMLDVLWAVRIQQEQ